jgi:hypothetical protein
MSGSDHFVQFFAGDKSLTDAVTGFLRRGFAAANVCIVIATDAHRTAIEANLRRDGFDPASLLASYDYIPVDAHSMLREFVHDRQVDRVKFFDRASLLLTQAASKGRPVRIFGEMVALLAAQGLHAGAIAIEEMCNELSRLHDFNMFCAYPLCAVQGPNRHAVLDRINSLHDAPWHAGRIEARTFE